MHRSAVFHTVGPWLIRLDLHVHRRVTHWLWYSLGAEHAAVLGEQCSQSLHLRNGEGPSTVQVRDAARRRFFFGAAHAVRDVVQCARLADERVAPLSIHRLAHLDVCKVHKGLAYRRQLQHFGAAGVGDADVLVLASFCVARVVVLGPRVRYPGVRAPRRVERRVCPTCRCRRVVGCLSSLPPCSRRVCRRRSPSLRLRGAHRSHVYEVCRGR